MITEILLISIILNMQVKGHHDKIKFFSKFSSWKTLVKFRSHYSNKNSEMFPDKMILHQWRKTFKMENLLSWQNILNSKQIATGIEEK